MYTNKKGKNARVNKKKVSLLARTRATVALRRARGRVKRRPCRGGRLEEVQDLIAADFVIEVVGGNIGNGGEVVLLEHLEIV